jgi:hypothetical protein
VAYQGEGQDDRLAQERVEWRRRRRHGLQARRRRNAERDAYLRAQLEAGEFEVAHGHQALVTSRRILFAWRLNWPPHEREWTHDAIGFGEISAWAMGRRHDARPLVRLEHPAHVRLEWVPAHHLLWFRWGNKEAGVSHGETTLSFSSDRDPVLVAVRGRLEQGHTPQAAPFLVAFPGTREERRKASVLAGYQAVRFPRLPRLRGNAARLDERLHRGHIHWWIRIGSWLLLAVPAWFIEPWLVVPAVALVEIAWIAGLQWSWYRDHGRHLARNQDW